MVASAAIRAEADLTQASPVPACAAAFDRASRVACMRAAATWAGTVRRRLRLGAGVLFFLASIGKPATSTWTVSPAGAHGVGHAAIWLACHR